MKSPRQRAEDGSGAVIEAQPGMAPCLTTEEDGGGGGRIGRKKKKCVFWKIKVQMFNVVIAKPPA